MDGTLGRAVIKVSALSYDHRIVEGPAAGVGPADNGASIFDLADLDSELADCAVVEVS